MTLIVVALLQKFIYELRRNNVFVTQDNQALIRIDVRTVEITVSQNLKSHMNKGQRLNYILDRSLYDSKMIEGEKSIFYRPVF